MIGSLSWKLRRLTGRIWFRAGLYGLGAIATVVLAGWAGAFVPEAVAQRVNVDSIRDLLEIMASSMLLVATFSLGTMAAAFTAAANIATPRAATILIDDPISQNVLATFVGAFVFSIVSLAALSLGYHGDKGRVLLLGATTLVILAVIATLFGWFDYLANMVRLGQIMEKVESRARDVLKRRAAKPFLGGRRLEALPVDAHPVTHAETGYLAHLDVAALERIACDAGGEVYVARPPGHMVEPSQPPVWTNWPANGAQRQAICAALTVRAERSLDQDPRYCLIVLSEIASRALSSGVNDFGTAIETLARLQRLLVGWSAATSEDAAGEAPADASAACDCPRVHVAALRPEDLLADAFGPLARDAADNLEVGLRLQKCLASLAAVGDAGFAAAARHQSERALAQARGALALESDRERIAEASARVARAAEGRRAGA